LEDRHAQGLVAINAVAGLAARNVRSQKFVEELWNTPTPRWSGALLRRIALHDGAVALQRGI
jgi:hypothetical protein